MPALLLAGCAQDEPLSPTAGDDLPPETYPLQISSLTISGGEEPWTRVTENEDGTGSEWECDGMEKFAVRLGDETAVYTLNPDHTMSADRQLYWKSTAPATVTAWYPVVETVDLSDQSSGLAYVLKAEVPDATCGEPVPLTFTHQLAKVRVVLSGTQAEKVTGVEVFGSTTSTHNEGSPTAGTTQGWLKMKSTTYTDGTKCWEANVVPGAITLSNFIQLNGTTVVTDLTGLPTTLEEGTMYTSNITVGEPVLQDGTTLTEAGEYTMSGNYTQGVTIDATGKDITIKLDGVTLNTSGIGINVQSDATIQVSGADNTISSVSAGIYVAADAIVTITGSGRDDQLTVKGGGEGAGIGGYVTGPNAGAACGNITISNVTVTSYGSYNDDYGDHCAGIGGASRGACGTITIENATVHAYGAEYEGYAATPAIGSGFPGVAFPTSIPVVTISNNSEVHAHRGGTIGNTDYIGWGGLNSYPTGANNTINLNGGTCTNSTVYCYTGDTLDKTVTYDASGTGTEQ